MKDTKIEWCDHTPPRNALQAARKVGISVEEWLAQRKDGLLWCYRCRQWKQSSVFGFDRSRSNGRASACKPCVSVKGTASRYKIAVDEASSLRSGNRKCDICGRNRKLEVDHDHLTGKVRGVLCSRCNGALGQFLDDESLLISAIEYLRRNT